MLIFTSKLIKHFFMEVWHIWIIVALVFFIIEMFTSGFAIACLSFGGIAAAIAALCGAGIRAQFIWFAILTFVAFIAVRPLILKLFFKNKDTVLKTGVDALVGRECRVSETIDPDLGTGRVAVDGDDWKAKSSEYIEKGSKVIIEKVESVIVTVKKI